MVESVASTLQTKTMLRATVDFQKPGKQTGFIQVPHSVHDDAWGVIRVPIAVISNGRGPKVTSIHLAHRAGHVVRTSVAFSQTGFPLIR